MALHRNNLVKLFAGTAALVLCVAASFWWFGSWAALVAAFTGMPLRLEPAVVDLGAIPADSRHWFDVIVRNNGRESVKLVGAVASCSCLGTRSLPQVNSPGSSVALQLQFLAPSEPGHCLHRVTFLATTPSQSRLHLELVGSVENTEEMRANSARR
jgi:hypothetical protein